MKDLAKKVAVGLSTAALLGQSLLVTPAFGSIQVVVSGNGSDTDNSVDVEQGNTTVVEQSNEANISNNVKATANTGGNDADDNTGGDVNIDTGDAESTVAVSNAVNSNEAQVDCNGCLNNVSAVISGNGSDSDNDIDLDLTNETFVEQDNDARIDNNVDVKAKTGYNEADDNTGGDVSIDTGNASAVAVVLNQANANVAHVGSGNGQGALELLITGNGSESENDLDVDLENAVVVEQDNWASIENDVEVEAYTGGNDAEDNTGGVVSIDTGNAEAGALVDTVANFNLAHVEDCCEFDGLIKIAGNGSDSESDVDFDMEQFLGAYQDNELSCGASHGWFKSLWGGKDDCNDVEVVADSGYNDAEDNTGGVYGDPSIDTGNATTEVEVSTTGNSNLFSTGDLELDSDWWEGMSHENGNMFIWLMALMSQ